MPGWLGPVLIRLARMAFAAEGLGTERAGPSAPSRLTNCRRNP